MSPTFTNEDIMGNLQSQKYARLAALVIVCYDSSITMDREIHFFWGKPWSYVKLLYFLNKYWGIMALTVDTWIAVSKIRSDAACEFSEYSGLFQFIFQSWSGWLSMLLVEVILMIRVHALFNRSKTSTYLLVTLFIVQASAMAVLLTLLVRLLHVEAFLSGLTCGSLQFVPHWFAFFWLPTVLVDLLLLILTLYKAIQFWRMSKNDGGSRLFQTLVRDQVMYFVGIFLVSGANMIAVSLEPLLICVAVGFNLGFPLIMGSRLLLNLREMAEKDLVSGMSVKSTTLSALVFASGQVATVQTQQFVQSRVPSVTTWVA